VHRRNLIVDPSVLSRAPRITACVSRGVPRWLETPSCQAIPLPIGHAFGPDQWVHSGPPGVARVESIAVTSTVWTQTASLQWAPELRYYEHRAGILRMMKEAGLLTAFKVGDSHAGAQLGDDSHEIDFSHRDLVAAVRARDGDVQRVRRAAELVLSELRPMGVGRASFAFQHLHPLEMDYDDARRTGIASLLGTSELGPVVLGDFANLLDGVAADPPCTVDAEYGIVSADEIPRRLSREMGRIRGSGRQPRSPIRKMDVSDLPPVALFIDATWTLTERIADDAVLDRFIQAWDACRIVSDEFAESVHAQLFDSTP
jgi:hypothetical protein